MAGARLEGVRAVRAAHTARRTEDNRRALVMRLVGGDARRRVIGMFIPGALEFGAVALWAILLEEFAIIADMALDRVVRELLEHRPTLVRIAIQQRSATPAVQRRGDLPAEIGNIIEPIVEPIGAIGRMTVRRIARDEGAVDLILLGDRDAQVPEANIIEIAGEREAGGTLQEAVDIIVVARCIGGYRRMEKPALLGIDATEELPVTIEVGMHHTISRSRRKALELLVELA